MVHGLLKSYNQVFIRQVRVVMYLLECAERCKDGATDPDTVLSLRRSNHFDLHAARCQGSDFLAHPVSYTREHGGSTTEDDVSIQVLPNIDITLHDGIVGGLVNSCSFHSDHGWLEEDFWATESFSTDGYHLAIRQLIALLNSRTCLGSFKLLLIVEGYVCQLFLHVPHNFPLSSGCEGVATLS